MGCVNSTNKNQKITKEQQNNREIRRKEQNKKEQQNNLNQTILLFHENNNSLNNNLNSNIPLKKRPSLTPLTQLEIQNRIDCSKESQEFIIDNIKYKYAYVSQRGFYPSGYSLLYSLSSYFYSSNLNSYSSPEFYRTK